MSIAATAVATSTAAARRISSSAPQIIRRSQLSRHRASCSRAAHGEVGVHGWSVASQMYTCPLFLADNFMELFRFLGACGSHGFYSPTARRGIPTLSSPRGAPAEASRVVSSSMIQNGFHELVSAKTIYYDEIRCGRIAVGYAAVTIGRDSAHSSGSHEAAPMPPTRGRRPA